MTVSIIASLALALTAQSAPEASSPPVSQAAKLSLENKTLLRCSAAFALVSYGQENGNADALAWPPVDPRGQEFFVRALAKLMDDTGMSRDQVSALASAEAQQLLDDNQVDAVMPACLTMLESSGL